MKEIETIKCPKCGTMAIKGTKKCIKCHYNLNTEQKSCPKCAKRNDINNKKCDNCGFNFNRKPRSIIFNVIISILLVGALFILVNLEYNGVVKSISLGFKIIAAIFVLFLIYSNINKGYKNIIKYDNHEEIGKEMTEKLDRMKKLSSALIIVAGAIIIIVLFVIYLLEK